MKSFLSIVLLALGISLTASIPLEAQSSAQLRFDRGNDQLESGNYRQALQTYRKLSNDNRISGALFLNMGICYVQLDSLGKAKYYFLKASRFEDTQDRAGQALQYVDSQFSRQSAVLPKLPWDKVVDWLRRNVGTLILLGIGLILLNAGVFSYVGNWFANKFNKLLRLAGLILGGAGIVVICISFYVHYVEQRYTEAVMVQNKTSVLEKPNSEAPVVNQAYEGYTFTVDRYKSGNQPGWSYVRMSNGLYGWIPNNEIMVL